MAAKINRIGKTYGDLTVFETIPGSNSKADTYLVKCNCCGNTMIIGIDALLKGLKCKDCRGKDRKRTYQDLVGEEHNGIKVISLAEDAIGSTGHRNIRYNCMCSCGKEFVAYLILPVIAFVLNIRYWHGYLANPGWSLTHPSYVVLGFVLSAALCFEIVYIDIKFGEK